MCLSLCIARLDLDHFWYKCKKTAVYHTLARWCQSVLRTTMQVNGKVGNSTPPAPSETPEKAWTDRHLNLHGWLRRGPLPYAKFQHHTITPFRPQICENVHQVTRLVFWFFLPPTDKTPARSIRQMTSYGRFAQGCAFCEWRKQNFTF